ncbi:hypothetical protein BNCALIDO_00027 [Aeromonas phage vB_AdhM_TS9]|nr:hypothetical protein BNCALIDO_00027 [Aeromonas phage vB_AdhM_TS9]
MTTYSEAVEQTITAGEQIHQIVNGTATTEVTVEDGSKVPSIRKALLDNFYFKDPIAWQVGQTENVFNQLRQFTDGSWWYAPSATASNPVSMGSTPVGDSLWKLYPLDPTLRDDLASETGTSLIGMPAILTSIPRMTLENSFEWANEVGLPAKFFGIKGDGSASDALRIQDAADAQTIVKFHNGVFTTPGVTAREGTGFIGMGWNTVFKLADGSVSSCIIVDDAANTTFSNFKIDGNKSNQVLGRPLRGLYFIGKNSSWGRVDRVWADNVLDHAFMTSVLAGQYTIFNGCKATNAGSAAHSAAGGPGGTGFACGGLGVKHYNGYAEGNQLNGWKCAGAYHERLVAKNCGSGFETGFNTPTDVTRFTEYNSVFALGCNTAMSHQGEGLDVLVRGLYVDSSQVSAVRLLGGVKRFRLYDSVINNYGQLLNAEDRDAILIQTSSTPYEEFDVDRNKFILNDAIPKTDRWALRMRNTVSDFRFGENNIVKGGGAGVFLPSSISSDTVIGNYVGNSGRYKLPSSVTLSAGTSDFLTRTILGRERVGQKYTIKAVVETTGAAGNKIVRLGIGGIGIILSNTATAGFITVDVSVSNMLGTSGVRVLGYCTTATGVRTEINQNVAIASLLDLPISMNATISSSPDTAVLRQFSVDLVE